MARLPEPPRARRRLGEAAECKQRREMEAQSRGAQHSNEGNGARNDTNLPARDLR